MGGAKSMGWRHEWNASNSEIYDKFLWFFCAKGCIFENAIGENSDILHFINSNTK